MLLLVREVKKEDGGGGRVEVGELGDGCVGATSVPGGQLQVRHHCDIR